MRIRLLCFGIFPFTAQSIHRWNKQSQKTMSQKKQFLLRIDQKVWEELNRWAKDELRSLNGQIEYVLREAVRKRQRHNEEENRSS